MFAFVYHLSTALNDCQNIMFVRSIRSNCYELAEAGFSTNHYGSVKRLIENKLLVLSSLGSLISACNNKINQVFQYDARVNCRINFVVIGFKIRILYSINFGVKLYAVKCISIV